MTLAVPIVTVKRSIRSNQKNSREVGNFPAARQEVMSNFEVRPRWQGAGLLTSGERTENRQLLPEFILIPSFEASRWRRQFTPWVFERNEDLIMRRPAGALQRVVRKVFPQANANLTCPNSALCHILPGLQPFLGKRAQ